MKKYLMLSLVVLLVLPLGISQAQDPSPEVRQWAIDASATSQYGESGWSALEATGLPNTTECGDFGTAWASATSNGKDVITLEFLEPVIPTQINIHQTYHPGSITQVAVSNSATGEVMTLPDSADSIDSPCPGVFSVNVSDLNTPVDTVIITVDQSVIGGWNEIDAVELVGRPTIANSFASRAWGSSATATSQYGEDPWSASQATGAPNTPECGDFGTAWASASSTGQDSLTVNFEGAVVPLGVNIYESYAPGSIVSVEVGDGTTTVTIPDSADPVGNTLCPDVFWVPISGVDFPVNQVTLHLDQTLGGTWNEIDAVQLVGFPLNDTFNYQGYNVFIPDGWIVSDTDGDLYVASDQVTLDLLDSSALDPLPTGQVGLNIALPDYLVELGVKGSTPVDILTELNTLLQSTGTVEPYPALGENAAITFVESPVAPEGAVLIADNLAGGTVVYAIQVGGSFEEAKALLDAILGSATFEAQP